MEKFKTLNPKKLEDLKGGFNITVSGILDGVKGNTDFRIFGFKRK